MDKYLEIKIRFESMEDKENALLMSKYMRNLFSEIIAVAETERRRAQTSGRIPLKRKHRKHRCQYHETVQAARLRKQRETMP